MSKLKDKQKEFRTLFGLSRDAILSIYAGRIFFSNAAAVKMFGFDPTDSEASSILPSYIFEHNPEQLVCSAVVTGRSVSVSVTRSEDYLLISIPVEEAATYTGIPQSVLSELRTATYNLKMAADQILARLNPEADPKLETYASILYHNYYSMLRLTGNIGSVSLLMDDALPLVKAPTDLGILCSQLISSIQYMVAGRDVDLHFSCATENMTASLDRDRIEQLLLNLLANSLQHTPAGGRITVTLGRSGDRLILSVDDSGSGMPQEQLIHAFSGWGVTTPYTMSSTGVGLFIARGIARLHGGALIITSREGEGTSVRILLPADDSFPAVLRDAEQQAGGMHNLLTEFAPVLGHTAYTQKHLD